MGKNNFAVAREAIARAENFRVEDYRPVFQTQAGRDVDRVVALVLELSKLEARMATMAKPHPVLPPELDLGPEAE